MSADNQQERREDEYSEPTPIQLVIERNVSNGIEYTDYCRIGDFVEGFESLELLQHRLCSMEIKTFGNKEAIKWMEKYHKNHYLESSETTRSKQF